MSIIGTFKLAKDGGWTGEIRSFGLRETIRFVPNDNRVHPNAPAFRVMLGWSRVGEAWEARSAGDNPRDFLNVRLDGPLFPAPVRAALFPEADEMTAKLVWNRRRLVLAKEEGDG